MKFTYPIVAPILIITMLSGCQFIQELWEPRDLLQTVRTMKDYKGPQISIVLPTNGQSVGSTYMVQGSIADVGVKTETAGVDSVYIALDKGTFQKLTVQNGLWSIDFSGLTDGWHTNYYYGTDLKGNVSATNYFAVLVQPSMPSLTVGQPTYSITTNVQYIEISGTASIGAPYKLLGVYLRKGNSGSFDEAVYSVLIGQWKTKILLSDGTNVLTIRGIADSLSTNTILWKVIIDSMPPQLFLDTPGQYEEVGSLYTISGRISDNLTGLENAYLQIDSNPIKLLSLSNGTFSTNIALPADFGIHTNRIILRDKANNCSTNIRYVNRKAIPLLYCSLAVTAYTNKTSISLKGSVSIDAPDSLEYVIVETNGHLYDICIINSGSWSIPLNLPKATNYYRVQTTSKLGNKTAILSNRMIILDTSRPTNILSELPSRTNIDSFQVRGNANDNMKIEGIYVSVSTGAKNFKKIGSLTTWSTNLTSLPSGSYQIYSFTRDMAGLFSKTNYSSIDVDAYRPIVTVNSLPSLTNTNVFTISGTASDDYQVNYVYFSLSKGADSFKRASGTVNWSTNLSGLPRGLYTLKVYSRDVVGNASITNTRQIRIGWWSTVGAAGFSAGAAYGISIHSTTNGTIYVGYKDGANGNRATVHRFNETNWVLVDTAGFSEPINMLAFTVSKSGILYLVFQHNSPNTLITVMRYSSGWKRVGKILTNTSGAQFPAIAVNSSETPYIIFNVSDELLARYYNGSSWVAVSPSINPVQNQSALAIRSDGVIHTLYTPNSGVQATVQKHSASMWTNVGTPPLSSGSAFDLNMAFDGNNQPVIAFRDSAGGYKVRALKYNGSFWVNLGSTTYISENTVYIPKLTIDQNNTYYVSYLNKYSSIVTNIIVKRFNVTDWEQVGEPVFSKKVGNLSIVTYANKTYVAYDDTLNNSKATVKMWEW